jgi:GNAT superfamily N-acetyltransferase
MITTLSSGNHTAFTATLPAAGTVVLRPLGRAEIAPQLAVFEGMSDASRYQRFLTAMPSRVPAGVRVMMGGVDGHRHIAWLASVNGRPAAVARCIQVGSGVADIAIEVADEHQRLGIGSVLLDAVLTVATTIGVRRVTAVVHPDNRASVRLLGHVGLRLRLIDGLLEGESDCRLPDPPRVDRAKVLAAHSRQAELASSLDDGTTVG